MPVNGQFYALNIEIYDESGKLLTSGSSITEWYCEINPIVPDGSGDVTPPDVPDLPTEAEQIYLTPLFTHFENWENSPNKGSESAVTQLLVGITDEHGNAVDISQTLDWELTILGEDGSEYFGKVAPATKALAYSGLYRFEVCIADEPFVPRYGVQYSVAIDVCDGDVHYYHGELTEGFLCLIDPIVPEDEGDDGDDDGPMDFNLEITAGLSGFKNVTVDGEEVTRLDLMIWYNDKFFDAPKDAVWCLRIGTSFMDMQWLELNPVAYSNGVYSFEPVMEPYVGDEIDFFLPEKGEIYTVGVEVYDVDWNPLYVSDDTPGISCDVEPIIPDLGFEDMNDLILEAVKPVWQWTQKNGKNVLTLTFKLTDADGNAVSINDEWELAIAPEDAEDEDDGAMLTLKPVSVKDGVYAFEIPLDEFTPEKGVDYLVMAYMMDPESGEVHMSMPTEGFLYNLDAPEADSEDGDKDNDGSAIGGKEEDDEKKDEKKEGMSVLVIVLISVVGTLAVVGVGITVCIVVIKKKRS